MRILILGGDGYLGWPTAMFFSKQGHEVMVVDNFVKRRIELENGIELLEPVHTLHRRIELWKEVTGRKIDLKVGDLLNHRFIYNLLRDFQPVTIIHYAEQPSAPYSMRSRSNAVFTQHNNVIGTLNLLFAMRKHCPDAHLIKLGTMGEYGTPNIDIEEGYLTVNHKGRTDTLPYPKQPGSFYHLSKVHDSNNILFACRIWGLRATDLNQGIVYGIDTDETELHPELRVSFHYDDIFGTVLNRFCTQAVVGIPLTVFGSGGQTRTFLNIHDTLQCVALALANPAEPGDCRVFNQFTETFSVRDLASKVRNAALQLGFDVSIQNLENPRVEAEEHYYHARNDHFLALGLEPRLLSESFLKGMLDRIDKARDLVRKEIVLPKTRWRY